MGEEKGMKQGEEGRGKMEVEGDEVRWRKDTRKRARREERHKQTTGAKDKKET